MKDKCRIYQDQESEQVMSKKEIMDEFQKEQEKLIKAFGFVCHYVTEPHKYGFVNYHTHGFTETWGHQDLQIVVPLDPQTAHRLFWEFADRIKSGEIFKEGDTVSGIIQGFDVVLFETTETGRDVLRIIFPDPNGRFPIAESCDELYSKQLEELQ